MFYRIVRYLNGPPSARALPVVVAMVLVVASLDALTGPDLSFSIFYLAPVGVATLRLGRSMGIRFGLACAVVWTAIDTASQGFHWVGVWNGMVRLGFFLIVSGLLAELGARHAAEAALARHDPTTELLNSRGFREAAERELERSRRTGEPIAFAYLDLDDFKAVNDTKGHETGDATLREFGSICRSTLRSIDLVSRMGGDEFALCLPGVSMDGAQTAVDRLREAVAGRSHLPGFSLGLAHFHESPLALDTALREADRAMYQAKTAGKGRSMVATVRSSAR